LVKRRRPFFKIRVEPSREACKVTRGGAFSIKPKDEKDLRKALTPKRGLGNQKTTKEEEMNGDVKPRLGRDAGRGEGKNGKLRKFAVSPDGRPGGLRGKTILSSDLR